MPLDVSGAGADFAVGCGYKYLTAGRRAGVRLRRRAPHGVFRQRLGGSATRSRSPSRGVSPAAGIGRCLVGTPPILSLAALDVGVDLLLGCDLGRCERSPCASPMFIGLVEKRCAGLRADLVKPAGCAARGSQVSFRHPQGYPFMQALIARGDRDFRAPTSCASAWHRCIALRRPVGCRHEPRRGARHEGVGRSDVPSSRRSDVKSHRIPIHSRGGRGPLGLGRRTRAPRRLQQRRDELWRTTSRSITPHRSASPVGTAHGCCLIIPAPGPPSCG